MVYKAAFIQTESRMGGVEHSTVYLARHLDRSLWEPAVVCPEEGDLAEACRNSGVPAHIVRLPRLRSTSFRLRGDRRVPNPIAWGWDAGALLLAAQQLAQYFRRQTPDLVITKGMFSHFCGGLGAKWSGIPCVWHVQDFISERFWGVYLRSFARAGTYLPSHIVADGSPICRQLGPRLKGKVTVVYNGVDTTVFRPGLDGSRVRCELRIPPKALVIGNVARMTPWKGQHHLLEAFAEIVRQVPDAFLVLVGAPVFDSPGYERRLRQRAAELAIAERVVFPGYRRDLPEVLAAMDIFAYPSVEKDTTPLALLSAMASGVPVVAFDIEGVQEVIAGPLNGLVVPAGSQRLLVQALLSLCRNRESRIRYAAAARRRATSSFTLQDYCIQMQNVFLRSLGGRNATSRLGYANTVRP